MAPNPILNVSIQLKTQTSPSFNIILLHSPQLSHNNIKKCLDLQQLQQLQYQYKSVMHSKNGIEGEQLSQQDILPLIQQYLGSVLFKHVHHYETVTVTHAQYLDFHHHKVPIAQDNQIDYEDRAIQLLLIGNNPGLWLNLQLLRILQYGHALICLAVDELYPYNADRFVILAIAFEDKEAASNWGNQYGYLTNVRVKNPYRSIHKVYSRTSFVITRPQNIIMKRKYKFVQRNPQNIKNQANLRFKQKKYQKALLVYQIALGIIQDPDKKRERAVLYANSSQCLFEMRLYESALIYAEISASLDRKYVKGIFRKFACLLQLRQLNNIPRILSSIKQTGTSQDFQNANTKYTKYMCNDIGLFDWKQMFTGNNCNFGQYYSPKLQKSKNQQFASYPYTFRAYQNINPFELVLVNKPLIYQKSEQNKFGEDYSELTKQIKSYSEFQGYFHNRLAELPNQCIFQGNILKFQKNLPQGIQINQIHSKCLRCLQLQKSIINKSINKQQYMGIWQNLYLFRHNCFSNCTYMHIKGGLVIFALKTIQRGQPLTIDFLNCQTRSRSLFMKQKLGRICDCAFCKWQWDIEQGTSSQFLYEIYKVEKDKLQQGGMDKICLLFLWQLIEERGYNQVELMKEYLIILQRYPLWQCVINCFRYIRLRPKNELFDFIKSTLKKIMEKYFKLTHSEAVALLKLIL